MCYTNPQLTLTETVGLLHLYWFSANAAYPVTGRWVIGDMLTMIRRWPNSFTPRHTAVIV